MKKTPENLHETFIFEEISKLKLSTLQQLTLWNRQYDFYNLSVESTTLETKNRVYSIHCMCEIRTLSLTPSVLSTWYTFLSNINQNIESTIMYKKKLLQNYIACTTSNSEDTSTSLIFKGNQWVKPIHTSSSSDKDRWVIQIFVIISTYIFPYGINTSFKNQYIYVLKSEHLSCRIRINFRAITT